MLLADFPSDVTGAPPATVLAFIGVTFAAYYGYCGGRVLLPPLTVP